MIAVAGCLWGYKMEAIGLLVVIFFIWVGAKTVGFVFKMALSILAFIVFLGLIGLSSF
jgi:hypothetical protein